MSHQFSSSSSSSSNQNFSTYVVIYCGNRVLIAKKNKYARWWGQTKKGTKIKNNPGDYVFPGGKTDINGIKEKGNKEFEEETGLTINFATNKIILDYQYDGLIDTVCTFSGYKETQLDNYYAALYVQLHANNELEAICKQFALISSWDNVFHASASHTSKYKYDDELENLEIKTIDEALAIFKKQGYYSEWFVNILKHLPNNKQDDEDEAVQSKSKTGSG